MILNWVLASPHLWLSQTKQKEEHKHNIQFSSGDNASAWVTVYFFV
ncbi:Uncharacterised protein [Citrobacter werkmanii]|uniref:Uncharacterized protein n=1 Tax=Citrobacter werkmanii TaxID=67827 RepID=A0A9N8CT81_9ENTR|nr:Uncharacterised protein [Citrobacter werkmanii]CAB5591804.1 Uncharacterised protein [Citrobacter werkmanii]CAB5596638.1 Uncharacterised protein [Citrobacter werkmanii]CAB5607168.1 Uncharacterised protein [Citrobacter werkmanii]CAB5614978.1 Uncharacterised protein [Citrobacter werkmanii]